MKLAVFDFDGTLFLKDTLPFLFKLWRKFGYSKRKLFAVFFSISRLFVNYKASFSRGGREYIIPEVMRRFTALFNGMSKEEVESFFDRCAPDIIKQLNIAVLGEIIKAKDEGYRTVLLSGCYSYLLELISRPLMIDDVIGTDMNYIVGFVNLNKPLRVIYGKEKEKRINEVYAGKDVDWQESSAYADSFTDLALLKMVGNPVAVDPDSELKKVAESMRWRIIYSWNVKGLKPDITKT